MPSFSRSSRSFSFPPCIDSVDLDTPSYGESYASDLPPIDDDPFAHFLTPVTEEDDPFDNLPLSAGIIIPDGPRTSKSSKFKSNVADKWARYVKHNHVQLHTRYHEHELGEDNEEDSFMQLDDDRLLDVPQPLSHLTSPPRITVTEPTRGRAQYELANMRTGRSRRRTSRTLSGHRHSWREPSPELFTVDESGEDDVSLKRLKSKRTKDGGEGRRSDRLNGDERSRL